MLGLGSKRLWSMAAAATVMGCAVLSGCALTSNDDARVEPSASVTELDGSDEAVGTGAQQRFFDNVMLTFPVVATIDPTSSWAVVEPVAWGQAETTLRETVIGMGEDACARADDAAGVSDLKDPAMTWLAARFLCPHHRDVADEFLSNGATVSSTHSMSDLFELALVQDDASTDELLMANTYCLGALALAWDVHEGFTPEMTCWLIRVQSVEESGGDSEYVSLFISAGDVEDAASDARFAELAMASGATPNNLSELLEGVE